MSKKKSKAQQLKSLKIRKRVLIFIESLVAISILSAGIVVLVPGVRTKAIECVTGTTFGKYLINYFGKETFDNTVYDAAFNSDHIQTNDMEYNYSTEYTHFAMFGIDSRTSQFDDQTNSDSILIVSIHNTTGEVRMASVYRDTYLRIYYDDGTYYYNKINAAYSVGGAEGAINTLNKNLDLQITDYVTVNFAGVAKIIDALGGINVNLTDEEVAQLNQHLKSTISTTGEYAPKISSSGTNIHLNGIQATTYCRIRKATFYDPDTGDAISDDYGRAARQRSVVMKLVKKAQKAGLAELQEMMSTVLKSNTDDQKIIQTSFTLDEMVDMLPIIFKFSLEGSQGFPKKLSTGYLGGVSYVFAKGLGRNVSLLHEFFYGEEDYEPTMAVDEISNYLLGATGVGEDDSDNNVDDVVHHSSGEKSDEGTTTNQESEDYDYDDGGVSDLY